MRALRCRRCDQRSILTPLFGGIPATAAIARTAVNVRSGARSRLAAITQSLALLAVVLVASQWVAYIPLAALAGVLIATAIQMVEASSVTALLRSTRGDAAALVITAGATIVLDLVTAVILGLIVAGAFALQRMARSRRMDEIEASTTRPRGREQGTVRQRIGVALPLDGPLFSGRPRVPARAVQLRDRVVVLRLSRIATWTPPARPSSRTRSSDRGRGSRSSCRACGQHALDPLAPRRLRQLATSATCLGSTPNAIARARARARGSPIGPATRYRAAGAT